VDVTQWRLWAKMVLSYIPRWDCGIDARAIAQDIFGTSDPTRSQQRLVSRGAKLAQTIYGARVYSRRVCCQGFGTVMWIPRSAWARVDYLVEPLLAREEEGENLLRECGLDAPGPQQSNPYLISKGECYDCAGH